MNKDKLKKLNEKFETAHPHAITRWAVETYRPKVALSSSFGAKSAVMLHIISQVDPDTPILFLNPGFHFQETLEFVERMKKRLDLNIREFKATPNQIKETEEKIKAGKDDGQCCDERKVQLAEQSLVGLDCWIAGLRRDQGASRKNIPIVQQFESGLIKVHPLANWTGKDIADYMKENNLPTHPLWDKGYTSIGCIHSTSLPDASGAERSGRWKGTEKTECGIHTFTPQKKK